MYGRKRLFFNVVAKLIAVIETMPEGFYLVAITSQTDDATKSVVLEVEHKPLFLAVISYAHNTPYLPLGCKDTHFL